MTDFYFPPIQMSLKLVLAVTLLVLVISQPTNCNNAAKENLLEFENILDFDDILDLEETLDLADECRKKVLCSVSCPGEFQGKEVFFDIPKTNDGIYKAWVRGSFSKIFNFFRMFMGKKY